MRKFLLEVMKNRENGLYLCELPTGNGKTFESAHAMVEYAKSIEDNTKIIYLTTLNKNLPEDELLVAYGSKEEYKHNVLRLRSNFDEVVENILKIKVPEDMQTDVFVKLKKDVSLYQRAMFKGISDKEYIKALSERITEGDKKLRNEITKYLRKAFSTKEERKKAIKYDNRYQWIGELYPAVFTDDYKILLMSVSKFMKRNSILIDTSYEFLKSNLIENAIIFIDEFDATKDIIQSELIDRSLAIKEDYLQLFRQIHRTLNPKFFSFDMSKAMKRAEESSNKETFLSLIDEAEKIENKYHVSLSIKTIEDFIDDKQSFLFNDGSFHTVLREGAQYIRSAINKDSNRIDIYFEDKETFYNNRNKQEDIVIYSCLREINRFISRFRNFTIKWANEYMKIVNSYRKENENEMNLENAISSIFVKLGLNRSQQDLLMGETCQMIKKKRDYLLEDNSFYQMGMEYYEFEDNDTHHDNTNLRYIKVYDTPEKIILYLAEKATVFGISATAEIDTVVGNYDLNYLKNQLKEKYHETSKSLKNKTKEVLQTRRHSYEIGDIYIHKQVIDSEMNGDTVKEYCEKFIHSNLAQIAENIITQDSENDYQWLRYCNILKAMCAFNKNENIQSMLYLGMALPKDNNPGMNEKVLSQLFEYARIDAKQDDQYSSLYYLRGDDFEKDKEVLLSRLANGEKIFVMSTYQTLGAGQNLQYKIPKGKDVILLEDYTDGDKRFLYKDFDALYLGDITHLTVNTYKDEKLTSNDLLKMLFQIEELYENDEMNYAKKEEMLKLAFRSYSGTEQYSYNELYKLKSVNMQATRMVLQAVGRMCRTFAKSSNVYLFIESKLLAKLYAGELKKRILPPEMEAIVLMREQLGKDYLAKENNILNKAERISSRGTWKIRKMLSREWTQDSMHLWEQMRTLVLQYPTASISEWQNNEYLQELYITSGVKQKQYLYSQYSDFNDVTIDFGNDKIAFKESKRAKFKGDTNEVAVYEMSEKESGLKAILNYPGMKEYFKEMGYALEFKLNEYLMSPVLFHNIYKGALGEVAGKFILHRELGIELMPITEPDRFEFFDYMLCDDVYVDFKNWKFTYVQDQNEIRNEIIKKMDMIGAKRVYIINVVSDRTYKASATIDKRLVEIPMLIKEDGTVNRECLNMINEEDY